MTASGLPDLDEREDVAGAGIFADINITPLTDIFLVLLIIFMATSVAMVDIGAKVMLPEVDSTQSAAREITVTATPLHEIYVNAEQVALDGLEGMLRTLLVTRPDTPVVLQGDREVRTRRRCSSRSSIKSG